jgi:hypothetical protein
MQITLAAFWPARLLGLVPTVPSVLQAGAALIVQGTGRRQSPELEMALVQHPVSIDDGPAAGPRP